MGNLKVKSLPTFSVPYRPINPLFPSSTPITREDQETTQEEEEAEEEETNPVTQLCGWTLSLAARSLCSSLDSSLEVG